MKPSEKRIAKGLWWDRNWPVLEGCSHCSPACDNCFAAEYAHRFAGSLPYLRGLTNQEGKWNGTVIMRQDKLDMPLKTKKPTVWFVAERSDLFHPAVPDEYLDRIFAVMAMAPQHTFMVLTKRPERITAYFRKWVDGRKTVQTASPNIIGDLRLPFPNLWIGATIWDQASAERNIPFLLQAPAAHRFVSIEPILDLIDLCNLDTAPELSLNAISGVECMADVPAQGPKLDWVICGGESGYNARPVHLSWVRSLRDQCAASVVPLFFKQWGEWVPEAQADFTSSPAAALSSRNATYNVWDGGTRSYRVGKKSAGRLLDGKEYMEFPGESECAQ